MKRLVIVLMSVAALALSLTPGAQAAKVPHGTYRGKIKSGILKGTWYMKFYRHGTRYQVKSHFGTTTGRTRFRGSTVIFDREKDLAGICHKKAGKYRYRLTRRTLKMTPIKEPCSQRRKVHSILYKKIG